MSDLNCPNCGADLTAPQAVRIAEYRFGHLEKHSKPDAPAYQADQPDTFTLLCNACRRLIRTLPLEK
nr:hypothetical protein [uncultured Holophaga sp.]